MIGQFLDHVKRYVAPWFGVLTPTELFPLKLKHQQYVVAIVETKSRIIKP
jgi:hypothetical protein